MTKLLVATNNPGKLREIEALLANLPITLVTPEQCGISMEVEETGETYAENAALKANAFAIRSGIPTLADDSGLEVDALDGLPGVRSARFAPWSGATDADRRRLLLERLADKPRPWTARFRCWVALAIPPGGEEIRAQLAEGICEGEIIPQERGSDGFGYDPIFQLAGKNLTMAELSMDEKNRLSHRGRAIQAARPLLLQWIDAQTK